MVVLLSAWGHQENEALAQPETARGPFGTCSLRVHGKQSPAWRRTMARRLHRASGAASSAGNCLETPPEGQERLPPPLGKLFAWQTVGFFPPEGVRRISPSGMGAFAPLAAQRGAKTVGPTMSRGRTNRAQERTLRREPATPRFPQPGGARENCPTVAALAASVASAGRDQATARTEQLPEEFLIQRILAACGTASTLAPQADYQHDDRQQDALDHPDSRVAPTTDHSQGNRLPASDSGNLLQRYVPV